ncbi:MAG: hypothetical protein IJ542_04365 [Clostridia bacterium]|nr:hypothetical protein [Clostridia bacterium]
MESKEIKYLIEKIMGSDDMALQTMLNAGLYFDAESIISYRKSKLEIVENCKSLMLVLDKLLDDLNLDIKPSANLCSAYLLEIPADYTNIQVKRCAFQQFRYNLVILENFPELATKMISRLQKLFDDHFQKDEHSYFLVKKWRLDNIEDEIEEIDKELAELRSKKFIFLQFYGKKKTRARIEELKNKKIELEKQKNSVEQQIQEFNDNDKLIEKMRPACKKLKEWLNNPENLKKIDEYNVYAKQFMLEYEKYCNLVKEGEIETKHKAKINKVKLFLLVDLYTDLLNCEYKSDVNKLNRIFTLTNKKLMSKQCVSDSYSVQHIDFNIPSISEKYNDKLLELEINGKKLEEVTLAEKYRLFLSSLEELYYNDYHDQAIKSMFSE